MSARVLALSILTMIVLMGCAREEIKAYRAPKEAPDPSLAVTSSEARADVPATASALAWRAPPHWQEQTAAGFRRGSFLIPGPEGTTADLSIIAFPGDAGGLAANLNRWRNQIGLPALASADVQAAIEHVDTPAFHVDLVDYSGETDGKPVRIIGAILEHDGESWFFKLVGAEEIVAGETAAFRAFIQTVAPPPRHP